MSDLIDPDELPFTRDELARAYRLILPARADADSIADHMAEIGPGLIAIRAERRAQWAAAGIPNAATAPLYGWSYQEEAAEAAGLMPTEAELSRRTSDPPSA